MNRFGPGRISRSEIDGIRDAPGVDHEVRRAMRDLDMSQVRMGVPSLVAAVRTSVDEAPPIVGGADVPPHEVSRGGKRFTP